jgi:outer membrane protein TolC
MPRHRSGRASVRGVLLAALVAAGSSAAGELPDLPPDPSLEDFLRVAEARSPGLGSARASWRAESEAAHAAGSFPDPVLELGTMLSHVETRVGPQEESVALMQRLPWFGKRGLRRDTAAAAAASAEARYRDERLVLRRDVTLAWLDLYWLGRMLALTEENLELAADLEGVVRARYRTASAAHADLARVQLELGMLEERVRSVRDRLRPAAARMNALLRRAPGAPVPVPDRLPPAPPAPPADAAAAGVGAASPRLEELDGEVDGAIAGARLARRNRWPDWTLGLKWIRVSEAHESQHAADDGGKDAVMVDLTVELPLFRGKYAGAVREADERVAAARSMREAAADDLAARAEAVLFEWRDADRRAELYSGALLPKARESYAAAGAAYRTGEGAFLDLIDAHRTLLDLELEHERARTDRARSAAELAAIVGGGPAESPAVSGAAGERAGGDSP